MQTRNHRQPTELQLAQEKVNNLLDAVEQAGSPVPGLLKVEFDIIDEQDLGYFRSEVLSTAEEKELDTRGCTPRFQRTMNSFFLSVGVPEESTCSLTTTEIGGPPTEKDLENGPEYYLVGYASPLTGGARRAARAMSGYTPLYKAQSHPDLWQMQTEVVGAWVGKPYMGTVDFFGCLIPCVLFPSLNNPFVEYAVQNPDEEYERFWEATVAISEVEEMEGGPPALVLWKDVDLSKPRVWWFPKWAWAVLRLEHGFSATHPDDPERPAMLGLCRSATRARDRRAPNTEAEWLKIPVTSCDPGDDEVGESDAGSINDDVERGLPTSSFWDPETKMSSTPRGNEPHPHPEVVRAELARNKAHQERVARASRSNTRGQVQAPARGGRRGRGAATAQMNAEPSTSRRTRSHRTLQTDVEMTAVDGPAEGTTPGRSNAPVGTRGEEDTTMEDEGTAQPEGMTAPLPPFDNPPPSSRARSSIGTPAPRPSNISAPPLPGMSTPGPLDTAVSPSRVAGTGPPRIFAPPPPGAPTGRSGFRSGPLAMRNAAQATERPLNARERARARDAARIADQDRGYTVEPQ